MSRSELHEDILDDIRFMDHFCEDYGYGHYDVGCLTEAICANVIFGTVGCGLVADAYVLVNDGHGPIMVEVGRMKDGKWSSMIAPDQKPVRVLRVGFDRSIWLLNPRGTPIENDLVRHWQRRIARHDESQGERS